MKKIITFLLALFCVSITMAQKVDTGKMQKEGLSSNDAKAQYILGLIRNEDTKRLREMFEKEPWLIQADINIFKDSDQKASVSLFCVAVDMGNTGVVQAFLDYGYGKRDLCNVRTYAKEKIVVSRAEISFNSRTTNTSSSSNERKGWFTSNSSSSSSSSENNNEFSYTSVDYSERTVVKSYFAYPLDFATNKMFDFLWNKGFRSNNLFTQAALLEAKETGKREVFNYIMNNKPESLADQPEIISENFYRQLLNTAKKNPNSMAFEALEKGTLRQYKNVKEARKAEETLDDMLEKRLKSKKGVVPSDTLGYAGMKRAAQTQEIALLNVNTPQSADRYLELGGTLNNGHMKEAINNEDLKMVQYLVEHGVKPNEDMLKAAIGKKHLGIVQCLVEHGAKPNEDMLKTSILTAQYKIADYLIQKGIILNEDMFNVILNWKVTYLGDRLERILYVTRTMKTPLTSADIADKLLKFAVEWGDLGIAKWVLNRRKIVSLDALFTSIASSKKDAISEYFLETMITPDDAMKYYLDEIKKRGSTDVRIKEGKVTDKYPHITRTVKFLTEHGAKPSSDYINFILNMKIDVKDYWDEKDVKNAKKYIKRYRKKLLDLVTEHGARPNDEDCKKIRELFGVTDKNYISYCVF